MRVGQENDRRHSGGCPRHKPAAGYEQVQTVQSRAACIELSSKAGSPALSSAVWLARAV